MPYQSPPFWCIDDNTRFAQDIYAGNKTCGIDGQNIDELPLDVCTNYNMPLECKAHTFRKALPLYFIDYATQAINQH